MISHNETRVMPYAAEDLYQLVADIEKYPEFLPWCYESRILSDAENHLVAKLTVGHAIWREFFSSQVRFEPYNKIEAKYIDGPFHILENSWHFSQDSKTHCKVDFHIRFKLRNPFFQKAMHVGFDHVLKKMMDSFCDRAEVLYGK